MKLDTHPPTTATDSPTFDFLNPIEVIDAMIELRIQLVQLQQQIQALEPTFFAACLMLNQAKIQRERAVISRKFTPAQWTYDLANRRSPILNCMVRPKLLKLKAKPTVNPT